MKVQFALLLGIITSEVVVAECMSTAYRVGDPIPSFIVAGHESLENEWVQYQEQFPESARLTNIAPEYFQSRPLNEQCLVEFVTIEEQELSKSSEGEKVILQKPCEDFSVGNILRLSVYTYCVENYGESPDFYTSLPYRHANIAENERY